MTGVSCAWVDMPSLKKTRQTVRSTVNSVAAAASVAYLLPEPSTYTILSIYTPTSPALEEVSLGHSSTNQGCSIAIFDIQRAYNIEHQKIGTSSIVILNGSH